MQQLRVKGEMMKISEFIERLKKEQKEHGDIEVEGSFEGCTTYMESFTFVKGGREKAYVWNAAGEPLAFVKLAPEVDTLYIGEPYSD